MKKLSTKLRYNDVHNASEFIPSAGPKPSLAPFYPMEQTKNKQFCPADVNNCSSNQQRMGNVAVVLPVQQNSQTKQRHIKPIKNWRNGR